MNQTTIHSTAIIAPSAQIGSNTKVGPYVVIEDDVTIGERNIIESHAVIKQYTKIGNDNHIFSHAIVGGTPQDLKFSGEKTWIEIGNKNKIREFATLHRGTEGGGGITKLGNENLCMAYTHVAHDCILGNNIVMSNAATLAGHVQVEDYAIIGGLSAIHQFCRIGKHAFIGGVTGITQDLPPWMLAAGYRAVLHGPNLIGLRRAHASPEVIKAFKHAFKLIWKSDIPRTEALHLLENEYTDIPEIQEFVEFIRKSERGICPIAPQNEVSD